MQRWDQVLMFKKKLAYWLKIDELRDESLLITCQKKVRKEKTKELQIGFIISKLYLNIFAITGAYQVSSSQFNSQYTLLYLVQLFRTNAFSANTVSLNILPFFTAIHSQSIVNTNNFFTCFYQRKHLSLKWHRIY